MIFIKIIGLAFLLGHYKDFYKELKKVIKKPLYIIKIPFVIIGCLMCCSFWVGLIFTDGNIPLCGFISLVAYLIDKYLIDTPIKL